MLCLTRKTDYALVALAYLGQLREEPVPATCAREIADRFGLPVPQMMNIMKVLARARLVRSMRGPTGGYELAVEPDRISLLEVVTAMEGPMRFTRCADALPVMGQGCEIECDCPIREPIRRLHNRLNRFLEDVTLADLLDSKVDVPLESVGV
jgi:Rrf2 family protein